MILGFNQLMRMLSLTFMFLCLNLPKTQAIEVKVGVEDFAPYYISKGNTGIIPDLISAAFRYIPDYQPKYIYGHKSHRLLAEYRKGNLDALPNLNDSMSFDGCRSDAIFTYRNVAVTLATSDITLNKISDLAEKKIVTFQGAKAVFGPEFVQTIQSSTYTELTNFNMMPLMIYKGWADISISDLLLFVHNLQYIKEKQIETSHFQYFEIFPPTNIYMGFRDNTVCILFNNALKLIRQNGEYDKIYQRYSKE